MDRTKIETLKNILQKAGQGDEASIKNEAKAFLKTIDHEDLIMAEQALIDEGMSLETMHHLCPAHMEIINEQIENSDLKIDKDHPVATMMAEHERILGFLDQLESLNWDVQTAKDAQSIEPSKLMQLEGVAQNLEGAENHHLREEKALFPALEEKGMNGPTTVMRNDHVGLRAAKQALLKLAKEFRSLDNSRLEKLRSKLNELTDYLTTNLKEHIFKEDHILYPASLKIINDKEWEAIAHECDNIGYCDFTPGK